ncbi:MAG: 2-C-methyl-D-erythritol 2,4-cyclodiphosphate synthase [Candidatus Dormiibacterota bacterium]
MRPYPGVGLGLDVHRFGGPGPLRLGGVDVDHPVGLLGHSDGDVLLHAVADAILGAAGLGDLGEHFPPSDERWRGASSVGLLARVIEKVAESGLRIGGVDATVVAQEPRLQPYRARMAEVLSEVIGCPLGLVSVKLKTSDGLGLTGRGEGVAALAVASVTPIGPEVAEYHEGS